MKITREMTFTVKITSYHPADPGRTTGPYDQCYPPEPAEIEFDLTTVAGFAIPYDLFNEEEWETIEAEILELHEGALADAAEAAQIDNYLTYMESF
jgi:hypothetical protein